jgi:hypothetical protein
MKGGKMFGYTENYLRVERPYDKDLIGKIVEMEMPGQARHDER